jgi:hypothetical protein
MAKVRSWAGLDGHARSVQASSVAIGAGGRDRIRDTSGRTHGGDRSCHAGTLCWITRGAHGGAGTLSLAHRDR